MKDEILRALKLASLPTILAGVTAEELAVALVSRNGTGAEQLMSTIDDTITILRDATAVLETIKRNASAKPEGS